MLPFLFDSALPRAFEAAATVLRPACISGANLPAWKQNFTVSYDCHALLITTLTGKTITMGSAGEYLSAWPRSQLWHDPIGPGSCDMVALRPEGITAKRDSDGIKRGTCVSGGYSAAQAAQDSRNGACVTALPAGEKRDASSMSVSR